MKIIFGVIVFLLITTRCSTNPSSGLVENFDYPRESFKKVIIYSARDLELLAVANEKYKEMDECEQFMSKAAREKIEVSLKSNESHYLVEFQQKDKVFPEGHCEFVFSRESLKFKIVRGYM